MAAALFLCLFDSSLLWQICIHIYMLFMSNHMKSSQRLLSIWSDKTALILHSFSFGGGCKTHILLLAMYCMLYSGSLDSWCTFLNCMHS